MDPLCVNRIASPGAVAENAPTWGPALRGRLHETFLNERVLVTNPLPNKQLRRFLKTRPAPGAMLLFGLILGLTVFRLWMTSVQRLWVMGGPHDDLLFLNAAESIRHFKWLGPYNETTLIKGPGYPLFLAFVMTVHLPVLFAQQLYYAATCVVFVVAVRPRMRSPWLLGLVYGFLLMNPVMAGTGNWMVLREGIYSGQCVLVVATLLGLLLRVDQGGRLRLLWAIAAGYALSAVVITREEGTWLAPAAAILLGWTAWKLWRVRRSGGATGRFTWLWIPALPAVMTLATILLVSTINFVVYHSFCVVEVKEPNFVAAIAAMQRVESPHFHRWVPVSRETREELYAVSPAFARLKSFLEGSNGTAWAAFGDPYKELHGTGEIGGAWWIWAVRQGVASLGLYHHAADARAYYREVAAEINAAIGRGELKAAPLHNTLAPPWRPKYLALMREGTPDLVEELFTLSRCDPRPMSYQSTAAPRVVQHFEVATFTRALPATAPEAAKVADHIYGSWRGKLLRGMQAFYGHVMPALGFAAVAAMLAMLLIPGLRRRSEWALVGLAAIIAATAVRCLLLLYIDVSSFHAATDPRYLGPAETFVILGEIFAVTAGISAAIEWWKAQRPSGDHSASSTSASLPTAIDAASTPAS